ncbi:MAG: hypothetical protein DKINENOH_03244 [bacterium]|nr:hypothetical protein [bacterium]
MLRTKPAQASATGKADFPEVFEQLKAILLPFATRLLVKVDKPGNYCLNTPYTEKYKKELFFGATQINKNYVSFHLFAVYMFPDLLEGISSELKKRMQGKSCFNFAAADRKLLTELRRLTKKGFDRFKKEKLL